MGALIQMQTCFSHVAVTPEGHQTETSDGSQTYLLQIPSFLQGALEQIEICPVWVLEGMVTMVLQQLLPLTGVFLLDCLFPEGCEYSEHRVLHLMLPPCTFLSYQT